MWKKSNAKLINYISKKVFPKPNPNFNPESQTSKQIVEPNHLKRELKNAIEFLEREMTTSEKFSLFLMKVLYCLYLFSF